MKSGISYLCYVIRYHQFCGLKQNLNSVGQKLGHYLARSSIQCLHQSSVKGGSQGCNLVWGSGSSSKFTGYYKFLEVVGLRLSGFWISPIISCHMAFSTTWQFVLSRSRWVTVVSYLLPLESLLQFSPDCVTTTTRDNLSVDWLGVNW